MGHRERGSTQKTPQNHRQRTDRGREAAKPEKPKEDFTLGEEEPGQQLMARCVGKNSLGTGGKTVSLYAGVAAGLENA